MNLELIISDSHRSVVYFFIIFCVLVFFKLRLYDLSSQLGNYLFYFL